MILTPPFLVMMPTTSGFSSSMLCKAKVPWGKATRAATSVYGENRFHQMILWIGGDTLNHALATQLASL